MRLIATLTALTGTLLLSGCAQKGSNPADPYEHFNRRTHNFNMAFDSTILKPPAKLYKAVIPSPIRVGINNIYNNVAMLPTIANDLLQTEWQYALKDSWRFFANSTIGIGGILDVASRFNLPPHSNDLGLTFAKWGNKQSPYIVIPFLGPSTIRDGMGMMFDYALFSPYPYISSNTLMYSLLGVRYIDIRSQMLETDRFIEEALDKYAFIRDAYLQHRNYMITGEQANNDTLYVDDGDEDGDSLYVDEDASEVVETPAHGKPSESPLTTSQHATHRPPTA